MTVFRPTRAEIDLEALRSNFRLLRSLAPEADFACPMVKANAYGHGDVACSRALRQAGAGWLGVALFEEAFRLRDAGDNGPLLVFGAANAESAREASVRQVSPVVSSLDQLKLIAANARGPLRVHLEFNTGMNRLGLAPDEAETARAMIDANPALTLEGVCTHLAEGEDAGEVSGASEAQFQRFGRALTAFAGLPIHVHALNSSALANSSATRQLKTFGIRPGIAVYGAHPDHVRDVPLGLRPVMRLKSAFTQFHRLPIGAKVSYGGRWQAKRPSLIGVLPVGYGDGYPRSLSNKGSVSVRGLRAPIAGTVCMDYFMADLTDIERESGPISIGEEAVLIGPEISADELAKAIGTISYEIFTSLSARVPRIFLNERAE